MGVQAGLDLWRGSFRSGRRDVAGVYFAYSNVDGLVTNPAASGLCAAAHRDSEPQRLLQRRLLDALWSGRLVS